jgi:hypothetical protein
MLIVGEDRHPVTAGPRKSPKICKFFALVRHPGAWAQTRINKRRLVRRILRIDLIDWSGILKERREMSPSEKDRSHR